MREPSHVCVLSRVHQDREGHQSVTTKDYDEHEVCLCVGVGVILQSEG